MQMRMVVNYPDWKSEIRPVIAFTGSQLLSDYTYGRLRQALSLRPHEIQSIQTDCGSSRQITSVRT